MASKGQETYAMMRFHLNIGQTCAVNHTPERGGDTIVLPKSLWDYEGNTTEAQASPQIPGSFLALRWLWGGFGVALASHWGSFRALGCLSVGYQQALGWL
jgi:hypothetical protein